MAKDFAADLRRTMAEHAASQAAARAGYCPPVPPASGATAREDAAAHPQDRRQSPKCTAGALAHTGWCPVLLTGLVRQILVRKFADPDNVEEPDLLAGDRPAVWRPGPATGILIESVWRYLAESAEKRPALLVRGNGRREQQLTINDLAGADPRTFDNFVKLWVGSHTVFAVDGTAAAADLLATEAGEELDQFAPAIRQQLGLHKFRVVEVGTPGRVEESTTNFAVPITVGWAYEKTWSLEMDDALPLTGVAVNVNLDGVEFAFNLKDYVEGVS